MNVTIHLGVQKTGSTLLQRNLHRNRRALRDAGVAYHRLRPLTETTDAVHLPALTATLRSITHPKQVPPRTELVTRELHALAEDEASQVILSDENILGPINLGSGDPAYQHADETVGYLTEVFSGAIARFILYVRRQDTYIESTYLNRIHTGRTIKFPRYLERVNVASLDWFELANSISGRIGATPLLVIPYETIRAGELAYIDRFLELCATEVRLSGGDLAPQPSNRSYSALALEMALRCNELLEGADLAVFQRFLHASFSNATHQRAELLSDEARNDLVHRFDQSNRRLFGTFVQDIDHVAGYFS